MPLDEEGAKWSCEPCIRGHRSSKCQHFDRMMMKVPKAGRPLAKCPHPKGSCSCQKLYAFMIRIPKGSTCLCRPVYQVPADAGEPNSPTPAPAIPTPSPSRVQKSVKRQVKTAPENLAKALGSIPKFKEQTTDNGGPNTPLMSHEQELGYSHNVTSKNTHQPGTASPSSSTGTERNLELQANHVQTGGCCSKNVLPTEPHQTTQQMQAVQSSCCGNSNPVANNGLHREAAAGAHNNSNLTSLPGSPFAPPSIPHPSSWQTFPTTSGQYAQAMSADEAHNGASYISGFVPHSTPNDATRTLYSGITGNNPFTPLHISHAGSNHASDVTYHSEATNNDDPAHDCSCGDNCQCLGCASHPFNNTTRQHVQEMGILVALGGDEQNRESLQGYPNTHPYHPTQSLVPYPGHSYANFNQPVSGGYDIIASNSYSDPNIRNLKHEYHPPGPNYVLAQQTMIPSEYVTIEYPVGLPSACSDITGSCQCGSECTCVGCLTHSGHNGIAVEENHSMSQVESTFAYTDGTVVITPRIPVLDNISGHFLGPVL